MVERDLGSHVHLVQARWLHTVTAAWRRLGVRRPGARRMALARCDGLTIAMNGYVAASNIAADASE